MRQRRVLLAWGITGAGHFLLETFEVMEKIARNGVKVSTFISPAGSEVVRIYGLSKKLEGISPGGYYQEVITSEEGASTPRSGRLSREIYRALIISPATANTVAKVVHGIADTVVTNAFAQAQKGNTPIYIIPTDQEKGYVETTLPHRIERSLCKDCDECTAMIACPYSAISIVEGGARIDLSKCYGCNLCVDACPYDAVRFLEKIKVRVREIDFNNFKRLGELDGVTVLYHPREVEGIVKSLLGRGETEGTPNNCHKK